MRDWILAWTIIGPCAVIALFGCIAYGMNLDLKEKDLAFKAGLQQCQNLGAGGYRWQRECGR